MRGTDVNAADRLDEETKYPPCPLEEIFNRDGEGSNFSEEENIAIAGCQRAKKTTVTRQSPRLNVCRFRIRQPVKDATCVAHLESPQYLYLAEDDVSAGEWEERKQVVVLRTVCWLGFHHIFEGVTPGKYRLSLRMKFDDRFSWPNNTYNNRECLVSVSATIKDDRWKDRVEATFKTDMWSAINKKLKTILSINDVIDLDLSSYYKGDGRSEIYIKNYNPKNGWFDLVLADALTVPVGRCQEVEYSFQDVELPWWKQGMRWDYVELARDDGRG